MFYGKFADEGDNPVDNIIIYIYKGRHVTRSTTLTTGSALKISFLVWFHNCIYYAGNYVVVFYMFLIILRVVSV